MSLVKRDRTGPPRSTLVAGRWAAPRCSRPKRSSPGGARTPSPPSGWRSAYARRRGNAPHHCAWSCSATPSALGVGVERVTDTVGGQLAALLAAADGPPSRAVQRRRIRLPLVRPRHPGRPRAARPASGRRGDPGRRQRRHRPAPPGEAAALPRRGGPPPARGRSRGRRRNLPRPRCGSGYRAAAAPDRRAGSAAASPEPKCGRTRSRRPAGRSGRRDRTGFRADPERCATTATTRPPTVIGCGRTRCCRRSPTRPESARPFPATPPANETPAELSPAEL